MTTVLIVEDERDLNLLISEELGRFGHRALSAFDGREGLRVFAEGKPDLVILDVMLPEKDGFTLCRELRAQSVVPILMLTARTDEFDRVLGLELGADDYVLKPFSLRELTARVKALLRRSDMQRALQGAGLEDARVLHHADLSVDTGAHTARVAGRPVALSPREFDLLVCLVRHPGRALTRECLLAQVWGERFGGFDRTVDAHVLRLRDKLGRGSKVAGLITTVHGVGYRLEPA